MNQSKQDDEDHVRLIKEAQRLLYYHILSICPNHDAVDDILQETNRVLWEKRASFEQGTNFVAWARVVARFQTMSFLKTRAGKSWLRFDSDLVDSLCQDNETQHDHVLEKRTTGLKECMRKLSAEDREFLEYRYEHQLSLKRISKQTSRSEGSLKQVYLRIRNKLKECIDRFMQSDSK